MSLVEARKSLVKALTSADRMIARIGPPSPEEASWADKVVFEKETPADVNQYAVEKRARLLAALGTSESPITNHLFAYQISVIESGNPAAIKALMQEDARIIHAQLHRSVRR